MKSLVNTQMYPKLGKRISFIPTPFLRRYLEQLVATGLWGRDPGTCAMRIVEYFIWGLAKPQLRLNEKRR
jgi:hypothetical protein